MSPTPIKIAFILFGAVLSGCGGVALPPSFSVEVFRPGTFNLAVRSEPATAFFVRLSDPVAGATFEITGPAGWNGNEPATFTRTAAELEDQVTVLYLGSPAQTGTYMLEISQPADVTTAQAVLTTLELLPTPGTITVTGSSASEVSANWEAVSGAASYEMLIREDASSFSSPILGSVFVDSTSATLTGLSLTPGEYIVEVSAFSLDFASGAPKTASNFDVSYNRSATFTIGGN